MNLPNKLTVLRIFMIPIFLILMVVPISDASFTLFDVEVLWTQFAAAIVFALASLTDFIDGKIARSQHLVTNFGKFADPLADKMLVMTAFICLVALGVAPAWVVAIIVCRELAVTGLRLLLVEGGEVMSAAMPGKIKTATQMLAIILMLLNNPGFYSLSIPFDQIMLYICLFFTIYSGTDYFWKNRQVFSDSF